MANSRNQPKKDTYTQTLEFLAGAVASAGGAKILKAISDEESRSLRNLQTELESYHNVLRTSPVPEQELAELNKTLAAAHNAKMAQLSKSYTRSNRIGLGLLFTGAVMMAHSTAQKLDTLLKSENENVARTNLRASK